MYVFMPRRSNLLIQRRRDENRRTWTVFAQERERATGSRLRRIYDQIKRMEDLKDEIDTAETLQTEAERASLSLPTGGSTETLIRYSTTVDRQYYRALDELWKLQDFQACRGGTPGGR